MTAVMIGAGPRKGWHTVVGIGAGEHLLGKIGVVACSVQAGRLVVWARGWRELAWEVEGETGLADLLARHRAAAGEHVLDVPPKLAARVRLLAAGGTSKNDPDDALPVWGWRRCAPRRRARCSPGATPWCSGCG